MAIEKEAPLPHPPLRVLAVAGSLNTDSVTRVVVYEAARQLTAWGGVVGLRALLQNPLAFYPLSVSHAPPTPPPLPARLDRADVVVLGTPDYHGCVSGALKNFLDHFWREFAGKLFATIVASHEKGLTVTDQLRTVARQCYAWTLPYGISFMGEDEVTDGKISNQKLANRLEMMTRDIIVYGRLLAAQRRADLASNELCFMERHR
jgi:NAD(P)H-dependent FMN reductase